MYEEGITGMRFSVSTPRVRRPHPRTARDQRRRQGRDEEDPHRDPGRLFRRGMVKENEIGRPRYREFATG